MMSNVYAEPPSPIHYWEMDLFKEQKKGPRKVERSTIYVKIDLIFILEGGEVLLKRGGGRRDKIFFKYSQEVDQRYLWGCVLEDIDQEI